MGMTPQRFAHCLHKYAFVSCMHRDVESSVVSACWCAWGVGYVVGGCNQWRSECTKYLLYWAWHMVCLACVQKLWSAGSVWYMVCIYTLLEPWTMKANMQVVLLLCSAHRSTLPSKFAMHYDGPVPILRVPMQCSTRVASFPGSPGSPPN